MQKGYGSGNKQGLGHVKFQELVVLTDENVHQQVDMMVWNSQENCEKQEEKAVDNISLQNIYKLLKTPL